MDKFIKVPQTLSQDQIDFFVNNGYLILPSFLSFEIIKDLIQEIERLSKREYLGESLSGNRNKDNRHVNRILAIHKPHAVSQVIRQLMQYPNLAGAVSQLAGAHLPFWEGNIKSVDSMVFIKPPEFPGHAWHQDECFIPTRDRSLVGVWIAIDNANINNGCLWIIPGSHRSGYLYPMKEHHSEDYDAHQISYGFDTSQAIPLEANSGTAILFNGYLLHQSLKNHSNSLRRAIVLHYMSSESLLPWFQTDHGEQVAVADNRKVIHVAGVDPYNWKGYDDMEQEEPFVRGTNKRQIP
ncbi:protein involved in biosynthesis of mitomycin antibiotics/polyketide fumonisin [Xenococcus sp. PCC 7305]|uniref:phytanoyl-CoA dioxygenase family protein n=1 Tax=Xenococcus sp. PCC 7305 TaxID=102125 RepID=UPI0002AC187F|nr:phytanoyl-CoA dioxygenase family protein [Xenococcus sp. PCC 7305]ELS04300.1 protein involved in biosynthesis of mitomycin antibiotics/polyketide fumonisin [Xenococcus sp. PCC 7305]